MRYLKQFTIILFISFLGEVLHYIIPLLIPASIYGLLLMLLALCTGVIKLSSVRETGKFLIDIMPVMFIPAAVGLLESWGILKPVWLPVVVITVVSTVLVMGVSGVVAQLVIRRDEKMCIRDRTKPPTLPRCPGSLQAARISAPPICGRWPRRP